MLPLKRRYYDLTEPILAAIAPWHAKIGQDGKPLKFIWDGDANITEVKGVKVEYDDVTGVPKKIEAKDQDDKDISIELTRVSATDVKASLKYDGSTQAEIEEQILTGTYGRKLRITGRYLADSDLNIQFDVEYKTSNPNPNTSVWATITFNNNTYEGWMTRGETEFPKVLDDYNNDLATFAKQARIAALNETMSTPMSMSIYQYLSGYEPGWETPDSDLCTWIVFAGDYFFSWPGTLVAIVINVILMYFGLA